MTLWRINVAEWSSDQVVDWLKGEWLLLSWNFRTICKKNPFSSFPESNPVPGRLEWAQDDVEDTMWPFIFAWPKFSPTSLTHFPVSQSWRVSCSRKWGKSLKILFIHPNFHPHISFSYIHPPLHLRGQQTQLNNCGQSGKKCCSFCIKKVVLRFAISPDRHKIV